jgi:predicted phosphodiesterase
MRRMMRTGFALLGLVVGAVGLVVVPAACSSSASSASSPAADAGPFVYRGAGCAYDVTIPDRLGFVDLALDDPASAGSAPVRPRIGLGGDVTSGAPGYADPSRSAAFTWQTADKVKAAKVRLGDSPDALTDVHAGYSWTTPPPDGFGGNEPETYMHEVHVCGLTAGKTYYYQVGGGTPEVWSATQSFTTVPSDGKVTVGVLGDARDKVEVWQLVQRRMRDAAVNLQLTTGDLVFVGSQESLYDSWLGAIWQDPGDSSRFITLGQQMMLMVAGNHEAEAARFYAAFAMPGDERYSSFDVLNTHFAMIDDQPIAEGTPDADAITTWLDADLGRAEQNRAKVPFLVVLHHRGLYTTSTHAKDADVLLTRKLLAPIYDKHQVDLVLNGHDHAFERSKPLRAGADPAGDPVVQAAGQGTLYVVNAGAGANGYGVGDAAFVEKSQTYGGSTPYSGLYGILTLEGRTLTFESHGLTAAGPDPVIDTFTLTR